MEILKDYMVIVSVKGKDYLVKTEAKSALQAEHIFLDMAVCGKYGFGYGVDCCQAFDVESMKTDTFVYMAMRCETVCNADMIEIIADRNAEITAKVNAYERQEEIKKQIKKLETEIANLETELSEIKFKFE